MNYSTLKRIGRIALIGSILYFLHTRELIAPEYTPLAIESGKTLKEDTRKVVVLDPGHGMSNGINGVMDWGVTYKNYNEADINLKQAKKIKNSLDSTIYKVILTREDNTVSCPLEFRPELANKLKANLYISIHGNNFRNWKNIRGFEVYWRERKDQKLANSLAKNMEVITSIPKRGVIKKNYLMLKEVKCPAVLFEMGYILNEEDIKEINKSDSRIAKAIAKTIEDYLK